MGAAQEKEAVLACSKEDLIAVGKKLINIKGREILLFHYKGEFTAMDQFCFHQGGPLIAGDIEEMGKYNCIVCPWHNYGLCLTSGEAIYGYTGVDPPVYKSLGKKQRMHQVHERDGNLYVILNTDPEKHESDYYYTEKYQSVREENEAREWALQKRLGLLSKR
ncbi:Rieske domain-containing protein [Lingula anatina]|uniref:Rieske domain-containing protein n=1 Tax=Lingula anatina TaxID=7574 RepID=A0A1S3K945_LINAN|nr:Rieske domain-containing protein [Lingula anatina]|eukprot:XP_013418786.1 Rieske domain-containing protein [Lingula anatina]